MKIKGYITILRTNGFDKLNRFLMCYGYILVVFFLIICSSIKGYDMNFIDPNDIENPF